MSASWQDEILPSSTRSSSEENQISETMLQAQDSVTGRLSQDAGVRLPPGGRLGVLLALYVLVIGPLAFLALRRFGRRRSGDAAVDDDDEPSTAQVRRPLAAWAAIPVVAVLSTGAVVGAGGSLRRTASSAHMTIYEVGPGGATATTWSLLSNPNHKGAVGVDLPEGWTASTAASMFDQEGSAVHVATTDDGLEATTEPPAGGFGVVRSSGPAADMADALEVTAESVADDVIRGTVRNKLDVPLEDVAVLVGRAAVADLGTLEPGEEREFEVERASQYAFQADPERRVWPDNAGSSGDGVWIGRGGVNGGVIVQKLPDAGVAEVTVDAAAAADRAAGLKEANAAADPAQAPPPVTSPPEPADEAPVEIDVGDGEVTKPGIGVPAAGDQPAPPVPPPVLVPGPGGKPVFPDGPDVGGESDEGSTMMAAWADLMQQKGWNYRPTGQVVVVGWTDELAPPVSASGSGKVARSRSAVVARATAAAAGDHVTDAAIVRSTVRGPDINAGFDDEGFPAMVSFDVPASVDGRPVDPSRLMFHLWGSFTSVEVWTPGGWVGLPEVPDGQFAEVALPEGALVAGQVFVRWTHPLNVPAPGREFVLYEKET